MKTANIYRRYIIISVLVVVMAVLCVVRLFDLQVVKGTSYETQANQRLYRAYSVEAPRGEIMDKNDKPLVKNRIGYSIQVQKIDVTNDELNRVLYDAAYLAALYGSEIESSFPIVLNDETNELEYDFDIEENGGTRKVEGVEPVVSVQKRLKEEEEYASDDEEEEPTDEEIKEEEERAAEALENWKKANDLIDFDTPQQILAYYENEYEISSEFSNEQALTVTAIRYAMDKRKFSEKTPYILARDVNEIVLQQIKEQFSSYPGIKMVIEPIRVFTNGTMAAHILGRTGIIYAEEYAEMKDDGYGMNDIIGKDGLEKVLEPYLKGEDGYQSVEMSRGGGVTQILESRAPKPGNFARLTIDSDLQGVMERALEENILDAVGVGGAGAAIAIDPKTWGVLATASYPTYDLTEFNEIYNELLKSKSKPLINRAFSGTYSPGSTFKPLTAIAALETGTITPDTFIQDKGRYTYFDSYQPTCLIYSSTGATHGTIDVSEAIGVSCNYFFYDVGRRVGIDAIDDYAKKFGLGETTGIELPESTGILASPKNREQMGGTWQPGDVLQVAIGQSDNMFTPAQLASYITTIINKGERRSLHLINEVVDYDTGEIVYHKEPELISDSQISDGTYNAVINGMRQVVTRGTASQAFATSKYRAAGKTGTAEVPDGADNVLFVGFAPYDDPQIVIAVVIEHGANSIYPARVARSVFDAYMEILSGEFKPETEDDEEDGEGELPLRPVRPDEDEDNGRRSEEQQRSVGNVPENSVSSERDSAEGSGTL